MSTTAPTRVTDLGRKYILECNTAADPLTNYEEIIGKETARLLEELRTVSDQTNEDKGAMREETTGYNWRIELKLKYSLNATGTSRNAVHKFLRGKFLELRTKHAAQCEFGVRWYHEDGLADEAHEGRVYVKSWTQDDGGTGQGTITIVLQGQGALSDITNPASSQVPVVTSVDPDSGAAAGGDQIVNVYGDHFTAASAVDFGANPATDFVVHSDSHITAIPPAGVGTVQVKVTTAAGASADVAADDYTYV